MRALLAGIDTHPANSLALMLRSIGYEPYMLSDRAMDALEKQGYSGGVRRGLLKDMGYLEPNMPYTDEVEGDLFIDLKIQDVQSFLNVRPDFEGKAMVYLINGGWDGYEDYGRFFPTITNNFWVQGNAFHVWSPLDNVLNLAPRETPGKEPPMGLLHNAWNWGFGSILDQVVKLTGLRVYGAYRSPMGVIRNDRVGEYLSKSLCFIHMKANDCPGWATYEAFATATPLVITKLFVTRMKFGELYEDGETCLMWGKTSFEQDPKDERIIKEFIDREAPRMVEEICEAVEKLKDPEYNRKIGMQGYERWKKLTAWAPAKVDQFRNFFKQNGLPV